jgi:hypothetical protein
LDDQGLEYLPYLLNVQTGSGTYPASYSMGIGVLSLRAQRAGNKADHSHPPCPEVENKWGYNSNVLVCLYGVNEDNCALTAL